MRAIAWERLEAWVRQEHGTNPKKPITRDTQLDEDLHVNGDDAVDFMEHFFEEFSIDFGDYNFDHYFVPEGFSPLEIFLLLIWKKKRASYDRPPITLGMLYQAALDGRWDCARLDSLSSLSKT
ncbi:DUF1493 family protein [Herbaspirillum sp. 1130]|uniref:DUF1493 family protein n=1 Tax=Herbaspirillum sp. 1130 TaxID=2806562 RepID=UPI001AE4401B|nr:DUF1493 family protein [Herbaspirillum sp. 1130]MBP1317658.1 hypothetical protein [Herbaspirillum sp. 1130]